MGLTMRERHAISRELTSRFQKATKKDRGRILDEFIRLIVLCPLLRGEGIPMCSEWHNVPCRWRRNCPLFGTK